MAGYSFFTDTDHSLEEFLSVDSQSGSRIGVEINEFAEGPVPNLGPDFDSVFGQSTDGKSTKQKRITDGPAQSIDLHLLAQSVQPDWSFKLGPAKRTRPEYSEGCSVTCMSSYLATTYNRLEASAQWRAVGVRLCPLHILISNIVCTFSTGCTLDLRTIAMEGRNVEFRREANRVTMMNRNPFGYANIWPSGKVTCNGATTAEDARKLCRRIARSIQALGFNVRFFNYRMVNVFSNCTLPFGIDLIALHGLARLQSFITYLMYEPELNSGVTLKIDSLRVTLKIFSTGSMTVIGPNVESLRTGCKMVYPVLRACAKK